MPTYAIAFDLQQESGFETMTDLAAASLLDDAEDVVDGLLGAWPIDPTTGRKIHLGQVQSWQADRLRRLTVKMAALLYDKPLLLDDPRWTSVRGPDFAFSGRIDDVLPRRITNLVNLTGLRRLTTLATPRNRQDALGPTGDSIYGDLPVANGPDDPDDRGDWQGSL